MNPELQKMQAELQQYRASKTTQPKDIQADLQAYRASKQAPIQEEDGIIKSILRPFGRLGVNAIKAGQMIMGQDVDKTAPINLPYLGATKPVGQEGTFGQKLKESLGVGTEVASTVTPMGGVTPIVKSGLKGLVGQGLKRGIGTGALAGSMYGAGRELQSPDSTLGSVAGNTLLGGGLGALGGGAVGGVLPLAGRGLNYGKNLLTKDVQTLRTEKIGEGLQAQNLRLKSAETAFAKNTIQRTLPDGTKKTITPIDTFAKYNIAPDFDGNNIVMGDYKLGTGALGKFKNHVQELDGTIDTVLRDSGVTVPIGKLRESLIMGARSNPELKRSFKVRSTIQKIESAIAEARQTYGKSIPIQEINEIRKVANFDYSPDTQDMSRLFGDVARKFVYNADERVKPLLQEQGELLSAKKYAEKINNTKLMHGTIGKHVLRTTGALLGATIDKAPIIGPVMGMLGGEALGRGLQKAQFKSLPVEIKAGLQSLSKRNQPKATANTTPNMTNIPSSVAPKQRTVNTVDMISNFNKFPRAKGLSPEDSKIQERSIKKYIQNKDKLIQDYRSEFGDRVVNTDLARRLFKDVGYNGKNSPAVHEASSALAKDVWKDALKNPESDVLMYAGGSGSGKSSTVGRIIPNIENETAAILDGNLSKLDSAVTKIQEATDAGKKVRIAYVYRDPVDSWINGVVKRMRVNKEEGGRVVPLSVFLENAPGSLDVVRKLKDMKIPVVAIDNSLGQGKARVMSDSKLAKLEYPSNLREVLEHETKKLVKARVISQQEYEALIK